MNRNGASVDTATWTLAAPTLLSCLRCVYKAISGPQSFLGHLRLVRLLPVRGHRSLNTGPAAPAITESGKEHVGIGIGVAAQTTGLTGRSPVSRSGPDPQS